jgi:hypothetical protein
MPTQLGTTLNPDLLGFLEKGLADEAAAVYAVNPTAAELAVAEELGLAFPEILAAVGFAVLLGIAAAWLLSKFNGARPQPPQPSIGTAKWNAPAGRTLRVFGGINTNPAEVVFAECPSDVISAENVPGPIAGELTPQIALKLRNGQTQKYNNQGNEIHISRCELCPTPEFPNPTPVDPENPGFPPLTPEQDGKIRKVGRALLPAPKPTNPPVTQDDLAPLFDALAAIANAAAECCSEEKQDLAEIKAELKKILDRVKKVSQNIGWPDLDGINAGEPVINVTYGSQSISQAFQAIQNNIGFNSDASTISVAGVEKPFDSIQKGVMTLGDRIGFSVAEPTPTPTDPTATASNLQIQIRRKDVEQADASFHVGYADTGKRHDVLKIVYTDTSKFKRRQNASITIPNPLPTLNAATIKNALPERTLGSWFCTLACGDGTRITGWFVSPVIGNQALTALAGLTRTGKALPTDFTATERAATTPAIAGTLLTATSYVWNRLGNDGNYTLVKGKL